MGPAFTSANYPLLGRGLGIGIAKGNHTLKRSHRALGAHAYLAMAGLGCVAAAGAWVLMRRWQGQPLIALADHS